MFFEPRWDSRELNHVYNKLILHLPVSWIAVLQYPGRSFLSSSSKIEGGFALVGHCFFKELIDHLSPLPEKNKNG